MSCLKIYTQTESLKDSDRDTGERYRERVTSSSCAGHPRVLPQTLASEINMVHIKKHRSAISFAHFRMHNLFRQKSANEFKLAMTRVAFLCFFKWTTEGETDRDRETERDRGSLLKESLFSPRTQKSDFSLDTSAYETKFGCKKIIGSKNIAETVIFLLHEPHYDFDLEDNKPTFPHNIPACNNAPPYKGWLVKV